MHMRACADYLAGRARSSHAFWTRIFRTSSFTWPNKIDLEYFNL
jgi:hypothetical protein